MRPNSTYNQQLLAVKKNGGVMRFLLAKAGQTVCGNERLAAT